MNAKDKAMGVGLGDKNATFRVYLASRPPLSPYQDLETIQPLYPGEITDITTKTGNHWRKIFNLYAKLGHALDAEGCATWQEYRERWLLQEGSDQALLFSPPDFSARAVHVVMGKQYFESLEVLGRFGDWVAVTPDFLMSRQGALIQCPYFDYRQLSNQKLEVLVQLILDLTDCPG